MPKRQQLPPLSEELEPGSVRFLGARAPGRGLLVAELSEVSDGFIWLHANGDVGGGRLPGAGH